MKKIIFLCFAAVIFSNTVTAFADSVNQNNDVISIESSTGKTIIDFSEATILDSKYQPITDIDASDFKVNVVDTPTGEVIEIAKKTPIILREISGGTWSSGSGYRAVKGLKINHYNSANVSFRADLELAHKANDRLNRVYNVNINTGSAGLGGIVRQGVFKRTEGNGPAYGGVQYILHYNSNRHSSTRAVYLKVGNDRFYVDINE